MIGVRSAGNLAIYKISDGFRCRDGRCLFCHGE
jgi:hypothetical protein